MRWNEDSQQLITCSKDKTIKIWQLPEAWIDEQNIKAEKPKPVDRSTGVTEQIWPDNLRYEKPYNTFEEEGKTSSNPIPAAVEKSNDTPVVEPAPK